MKQISDEFIIRALYCDGYENAGFVSSAASALLRNLANASPRLSPHLISTEIDGTESAVRRQKNVRRRLPVIYLPGLVTFPQICFIR